MKDFHKFLTEGKDERSAFLPLIEAAIVIAAMWVFLVWDPFRINQGILEILRANFQIFMREPKLAAYAYANTGALVAKTVAIALIAIFAAFSRDGAVEALGLKMPQYAGWTRYICLFLILPLVTRMAYAGNPLLPDLPIRFVYPEAMVIGNIMITFLIVLFAPIVEELIFRGYIYGVFRARLGAGYSVILTSVLFVMAHLPQVGLNAAGISTMSLTAVALGVARYRSGSVIPSVIFHGVYNLTYALSGTAFYLLMGR